MTRHNTSSDELPLSHHFILALNLLVTSAKIHQDNNRILVTAVKDFIDIVQKLVQEDDDVTLLTPSGRFYLQQEKLVYRPSIAALVHSMLQFFEKRKMNGFRFYPHIADAPLGEITTFARLLNTAAGKDDPAEWFEEELAKINITWVHHVQVSDSSYEEVLKDESDQSNTEQDNKSEQAEDAGHALPQVFLKGPDKKKKALQTYGYAIHSLEEIAQKVSANKKAGIKKTLRMVHKMIDMVIDDMDMFLGLSTIRDYDDYTFTHSLNVAILSMCLGHKIGLSKTSLETLGLSALFHDLGKIDVPKEILNKPGRLDDRELKEMKNHSLYSVRRIILLKAAQTKKAQFLLAPFEHHLKYDLSGYPQTPREKPISLFGRIIAIADVFDAITAARIYRPFTITPDRALGIMLEGSGRDFDPILLKFFINMVGVYPVGTVLRLDNDELGLVLKYTGDPEENKELWILLLEKGDRGKFRKGAEISLGKWNQKTGAFQRPIEESIHPSELGIQPADFLL